MTLLTPPSAVCRDYRDLHRVGLGARPGCGQGVLRRQAAFHLHQRYLARGRHALADSTPAGVEFTQAPAKRPYGVEAILRDDSGNWYSFTQRAA